MIRIRYNRKTGEEIIETYQDPKDVSLADFVEANFETFEKYAKQLGFIKEVGNAANKRPI